MKFFLAFSAGLVLFAGCSGDGEKTTEDIEAVPELVEEKMTEVEKVIYSDTIHQFYDVPDEYHYSSGSDAHDSLITINKKVYRLHVACELDKNQRVAFNDNYAVKDKWYMTTQVGYQAYYTISLFDGTKQLFKTKLKKEDFREADYYLVLASNAYLPQFVEYNPAFKALVFQVPFYIEESCSASDALLVMGLDGKVKTVDYLSGPSGHNTSCDIQITPNKQHLVTSSYIHHSDGTKRSFLKDGLFHMGTDVFDDCLLVVYDYDPKKQPKNAYLQDYAGKTLLNFKYQGWTGGLGHYFLHPKVKNAYYFVDEPNKYLIRVQKKKGKWQYQNLPFSNMQEYDGQQRSNEMEVNLSTETVRLYFYIDSDSGKIRKSPIETFGE